MKLSEAAERLLNRMKHNEGRWISLSEGRDSQQALRELELNGMIGFGQSHGRDGYVLSKIGLQYEKEV